MKVNGTNGVGSVSGASKARGADGQGFQLPTAGAASAPAQAARATGLSGVMSVDSILALQEMGGPLERRRRAVRRAGRLLDVLDDLKLGLLAGEMSQSKLDALRSAIRDEREGTEDIRLEGVLDEIETRAAVELAKLECARRAA
ncbi:flagellar assembly protein FliX [Phenylobacterium sp.]|uniref:flagellar assembly regulator FliX n=1 Tax=Phenylobacterium sp. TaxID=1871053 RepID=UPI0030F3AA95